MVFEQVVPETTASKSLQRYNAGTVGRRGSTLFMEVPRTTGPLGGPVLSGGEDGGTRSRQLSKERREGSKESARAGSKEGAGARSSKDKTALLAVAVEGPGRDGGSAAPASARARRQSVAVTGGPFLSSNVASPDPKQRRRSMLIRPRNSELMEAIRGTSREQTTGGGNAAGTGVGAGTSNGVLLGGGGAPPTGAAYQRRPTVHGVAGTIVSATFDVSPEVDDIFKSVNVVPLDLSQGAPRSSLRPRRGSMFVTSAPGDYGAPGGKGRRMSVAPTFRGSATSLVGGGRPMTTESHARHAQSRSRGCHPTS